mmetsp:Transcript_67020/g.212076  ORF Transcript_67020/g.212076 Transcript_67020/m.212076 type:complete len:266 (+) Transcript_67020:512-1309(+)
MLCGSLAASATVSNASCRRSRQTGRHQWLQRRRRRDRTSQCRRSYHCSALRPSRRSARRAPSAVTCHRRVLHSPSSFLARLLAASPMAASRRRSGACCRPSTRRPWRATRCGCGSAWRGGFETWTRPGSRFRAPGCRALSTGACGRRQPRGCSASRGPATRRPRGRRSSAPTRGRAPRLSPLPPRLPAPATRWQRQAEVKPPRQMSDPAATPASAPRGASSPPPAESAGRPQDRSSRIGQSPAFASRSEAWSRRRCPRASAASSG